MIYKKITINPKSWFITPWESDTILSYVFAWAFMQNRWDIIKIFEDFRAKNPPFLITNWFASYEDKVYISKPIYFFENLKKSKLSLKDAILNEKKRKRLKKVDKILLRREILEKIFSWKELDDQTRAEFIKQKEIYQNLTKEDEVWKNMIPRFNSWETNPYSIIVTFVKQIVVYVKIFDKEKFKSFYSFLKEVFETIWYWAGKSRWFWKIEKVELKDLNEKEKKTFEYLEELRKNWIYLVLNNYKPTEEELKNIDLSRSFIDINWKNTKTLWELNEKFFKWRMNFIKEGSVIISGEKLKGDFYESNGSYNFGYMF